MTVGEPQLTEHADEWVLPLVGREVDQICLDFAVTLVVDGSETVRLAAPFALDVGGEVHTVDPQHLASVPPVLGLHRAVVTAACAGKDGVLQLRFDRGRELRCEPDDVEEAWEAEGGLPPVTAAYQIAAKPGGGVSIR